MGFIKLKVKDSQARVDAVGNGVPGGNIAIDKDEPIEWKNGQPASKPRVFLVRFFDYSGVTPKPIWPFPASEVPADRKCVDSDGVEWLRVTDVDIAPKLHSGLPTWLLKYEAHVEASGSIRCLSDDSIEALDPMIIIRPKTNATDSVLLGVVCAVLGAAVGAAVAYAMMS